MVNGTTLSNHAKYSQVATFIYLRLLTTRMGEGTFLNVEGWRGEGGAGESLKVTGISGCKENRKSFVASHALCASALTNTGMGEGTFLNAEGWRGEGGAGKSLRVVAIGVSQ